MSMFVILTAALFVMLMVMMFMFILHGVEKLLHQDVFEALDGLDENRAGVILRAKGILPAEDGSWIHFDYVPGESEIRTGSADVTGRLTMRRVLSP